MGYYFILHHLVLFLFWTLLAPLTSLHSLSLSPGNNNWTWTRKKGGGKLTALKSLETFIGPVYFVRYGSAAEYIFGFGSYLAQPVLAG